MKKLNANVIFVVVLFALLPLMGGKFYANTKADAGKLKKAPDTASHELWGKVLAKRVDEKGLVDYEGLKKEKADLKNLQAYLDHLAAFDPEKLKDKKEKLAFWINCYNAATIAGVLKFKPEKSVKEVKDFWHRVIVHVGENEYSLGDIENTILRNMDEPRIHWALVRASKGCAGLLAEPYTAGKLEEQLGAQEKSYLAGRRQVYLDRKRKALMLSSLFYWYGPDFVRAAGTKLSYVRKYLSEEDLEFIEDNPIATKYIKYDWSLNSQSP